ncbi:MAG: toxin-antitoxin system, antitoxin component, Xre family protein [Xanthomonadales bacterium]|nr:toxin-antitoxin system, antitoxin component, Xre family protein [Xanthomonadales bacterium]
MSTVIDQLTEKLAQLPPERIAEVVDFVDFIAVREHDRRIVRAAQAVSETTLSAVWNNDADAAYDRL